MNRSKRTTASSDSRNSGRSEKEQVEAELEELFNLGLERSENKARDKDEPDLELLEMFSGYREAQALQKLLKNRPKVAFYSIEGYQFYTLESIGDNEHWVFYDRSFCSCKANQKCCHIYFLDICIQKQIYIPTGHMDMSDFSVGLFNAIN